MELIKSVLLVIHASSGMIALVAGMLIMFLIKGDQRHRKIGRTFYFAMWLVSISAFALCWIGSSQFLLHIGLFVLYQNISGYRAVQEKKLSPVFYDWLVLCIAAVNGLWMIFSGQIILIVFGAINTLLVVGHLQIYYKVLKGNGLERKTWLRQHIGHMMGAYIGTFTAFLVVNTSFLGSSNWAYLVWFGPSFIFVPLSAYWQAQVRQPKSLLNEETRRSIDKKRA